MNVLFVAPQSKFFTALSVAIRRYFKEMGISVRYAGELGEVTAASIGALNPKFIFFDTDFTKLQQLEVVDAFCSTCREHASVKIGITSVDNPNIVLDKFKGVLNFLFYKETIASDEIQTIIYTMDSLVKKDFFFSDVFASLREDHSTELYFREQLAKLSSGKIKIKTKGVYTESTRLSGDLLRKLGLAYDKTEYLLTSDKDGQWFLPKNFSKEQDAAALNAFLKLTVNKGKPQRVVLTDWLTRNKERRVSSFEKWKKKQFQEVAVSNKKKILVLKENHSFTRVKRESVSKFFDINFLRLDSIGVADLFKIKPSLIIVENSTAKEDSGYKFLKDVFNRQKGEINPILANINFIVFDNDAEKYKDLPSSRVRVINAFFEEKTVENILSDLIDSPQYESGDIFDFEVNGMMEPVDIISKVKIKKSSELFLMIESDDALPILKPMKLLYQTHLFITLIPTSLLASGKKKQYIGIVNGVCLEKRKKLRSYIINHPDFK